MDMMDGLIVELLKDKWKTFVGHRCVKLRAQFLTFFNQILIVTANCLQISLDFPNVSLPYETLEKCKMLIHRYLFHTVKTTCFSL